MALRLRKPVEEMTPEERERYLMVESEKDAIEAATGVRPDVVAMDGGRPERTPAQEEAAERIDRYDWLDW